MFWETWCPAAKSVASQGAGMLTSFHAPKPQGNSGSKATPATFYGSKKQTEDKGKTKIVTRPRTKSRPWNKKKKVKQKELEFKQSVASGLTLTD